MKIFKKFIITMIILLLCSCSNSEVENIDENFLNINTDESFNATDSTYLETEFQMTALANGEIRDEEYFETWQSYIEENFGIKINLRFVLDIGNDSDMYKYSKEFIVNGESGLYFVESTYCREFLEFAVEYGLVLDISQYLEENKTWKELPQKYKEIYEESGVTWGLANSSVPFIYGRFLNREWLENLEIDKPKNLVELYDLFNKFTYNDPDLNEKNDTYGLAYNSVYDFIDIFNANGCYLDFSRGRTSIAYNPITKKYEDCMFKDNIYEVFEYISGLNNNGLIRMNKMEEEVGSYYGRKFDEKVYVLNDQLQGENDSPTIPYSYINDAFGAYFLSSNLDEPEMVINAFVDIFYGSKQGNQIASHGLNTDKENIMIPFICEDLYDNANQLADDISSLAYYVYPKNQVLIPFDNVVIDMVDGSVSTGDTYYSLLRLSVGNAFNSSISIDDNIEAYRINAKKLGVNDVLDRLNN